MLARAVLAGARFEPRGSCVLQVNEVLGGARFDGVRGDRRAEALLPGLLALCAALLIWRASHYMAHHFMAR